MVWQRFTLPALHNPSDYDYISLDSKHRTTHTVRSYLGDDVYNQLKGMINGNRKPRKGNRRNSRVRTRARASSDASKPS